MGRPGTGCICCLMCRLQEARPESEAEALLLSPRGPGDAAKWTATRTAADGAERGRIYRSRHNTGDAVFRSGWEPAQQFHKVAGSAKGRVASRCCFEARRAGTSSRAARQQTDSFVPVCVWGGGGEGYQPTREEVSVRGRVWPRRASLKFVVCKARCCQHHKPVRTTRRAKRK